MTAVRGIAIVRRIPTASLTAAQVASIRTLLWAAFPPGEEGFTEDDWEHALGGMHFLVEQDGRVVSHASVVERMLWIGDAPVRTGYVEAVATEPALQGRGLGTSVMRDVGNWIRDRFQLGALGTGSQAFYERLGWRTWQGHSFVRTDERTTATPEEDGYIMVLTTPTSPPLDLQATITCQWRPGDVW